MLNGEVTAKGRTLKPISQLSKKTHALFLPALRDDPNSGGARNGPHTPLHFLGVLSLALTWKVSWIPVPSLTYYQAVPSRIPACILPGKPLWCGAPGGYFQPGRQEKLEGKDGGRGTGGL